MSLQRWKKKKDKATSEGNLEDLFTACSELAELHRSQEEFDVALKEYKEAKRAAEAANNQILVAVSHRMIGEVYSSLQNYDFAIKHELKYLELARTSENLVEEQRALATLGHIYLLKAETFANPDSSEKQEVLDKAKKYSLLSLQICEKLTSINRKELIEMQARLYLNLGLTVEQQSELESAISYLQRAINLCKSMDIWEILYRAYNSLACLFHQHQGNHSRALENLDKAIGAAQRLHDKNQLICDVLLIKADVLFDLPDFRGAKQCLLKAYKLNTDNRNDVEKKLRTVAAVSQFEEKLLNTPDYDLATKKSLYESLGDGCVSMKSFSKALEYYYLMLETAKNMGESGEQLRPCYVSLSQTYKDNKQYDLAIKYFNEELNLNSNNPVEACKTTLSIAEALEIKDADVDEILKCYKDAQRLAQSAKNQKLEARSLSCIIRLLNENNRISDARKMEAELNNLKEHYGLLLSSSESEEEEESTPDIGADICIDELSDVELENEPDSAVRTRKKCAPIKFRRNEKGEFPLHTACISGNLTLVKKLLDQGHPVNVRDHNGWLPLHEACNFGFLEIVRELLDRGAAINDKGTDGCDGMTPLLDAACCGNLSVMLLLLERGASPLMRTNKGETVLDCLIAWRKRYIQDEKRDLDPETMDQYNDLVRTLRASLKKAGHKPETERRSPSHSPPTQTQERVTIKRSSGHEVRDTSTQRAGPSSSARRSTDEESFPLKRSFTVQDKAPKPLNSSLRRSMDDVSAHQSTNAAKEYEDAMRALRHKSATLPSSPSPPPCESRSALIDEVEIVNDWLVNDLAPNRGIKRRRTHQFDGEPQRRPNRLNSPERNRGHSLETEQRNILRPVSPENSHSDSNDSLQIHHMDGVEQNEELSELTNLISSEEHVSQEHSVQQLRTSSSGVTSTYQVPLSMFGVVRNVMPRQLEPEPGAPTQLPASQTLILPSNTQVAPPSIKIRVEGKLLLIPLPTTDEPLTIAWLAEEVAKRYYSFEGVEPKLNVTTEDGAMLAPQDPVTLLLSYREVIGVVTSWKTHPITERYKEACSELGVDVDEYLEQCLDISQASFSMNIKGCSLDAEMVTPVFRASANQTSLQHLILSDNRLGDTGMQLLAKLIIKLPHLRELDLTCNAITYEGLNIFVHHTVEHQACKRLESLKLCHNQLGKSCLKPLSQLLQVTKSLSTLSLKSVGITEASFTGAQLLPLEVIERLEVGHNVLGRQGVRALLRGLSLSRVQKLGLAQTGAGVPREVADWLAEGDPCRLHTLDLSYCTDQEAAFSQLIRCLEKAPLLEHLEITCPEMTNELTMQSLYQLPLRVLRLPGVRVSALPLPPPPIHELSCLSLAAPPWAAQGPFGLLINNTSPSC